MENIDDKAPVPPIYLHSCQNLTNTMSSIRNMNNEFLKKHFDTQKQSNKRV